MNRMMSYLTNHHTAFRTTKLSARRKRRRLSYLPQNNHKTATFGYPVTVLQTLHPHFKTWASTSHTESILRCAYCRTIYHYKDKCFLRLNPLNYTNNLTSTNCCHTKIHSECKKELTELITLLTFDHTLECGQIANCTLDRRLIITYEQIYIYVIYRMGGPYWKNILSRSIF